MKKQENKPKFIFQNSKRIIKEGNNFGKGILYCGEKYTKENCCSCGTCDGRCGPDDGCPCPDCQYTLSYILYSTGKMKCEICKKTLLRINIFNLNNIYNYNTYKCNICHFTYTNEYYSIPLMHCMKCNYNMCPKCAFSKISFFEEKTLKLEAGFNLGKGIIYCLKNYTDSGFCLCGGCDGNCGPENGCPCPLCDSILGYNIYLKSNKMKCSKCKNLLVKTTLGLLKTTQITFFKCYLCNYTDKNNNFQIVYHCFNCNKDICQQCGYKNNITDVKKLSFPNAPIFLEKTIKEKIKENNEKCKISKQKGFKIIKKSEDGKNIILYLKKLVGTMYRININESENIIKIKEELRKIDGQYKEYNTILVWKNKILEDDEYINNYKIENESVINIILKQNQ